MKGLFFFFDEGRFGLQSTLFRMWAKRGTPLPVPVQQGFQSFYIYSCVAPQSGDAFSLFLPEVNTEMMALFLKELSCAYSCTSLVVVLDQAGWHKAKALQVPQNISLLFLPPYSPELNPVERLWKWLRKEVTHNRIFASLHEMMNALEKQFQSLTPQHFSQLCRCSYL